MECIVCRRPSKLTQRQRKSSSSQSFKLEVLQDQLVVVHFFQQFLGVTSSDVLQDGGTEHDGGEPDTLEDLLKTLGNPVNWASFCSACSPLARRACDLHVQLTKIQGQLEQVRSKVEDKIALSRKGTEEPLKEWARRYFQQRIQIQNESKNELDDEFSDSNNPTFPQDEVKLEPPDIQPDDEVPSSPYFQISFEDLKVESEDSSLLNVEDFVIDPTNATDIDFSPSTERSDVKVHRGRDKNINSCPLCTKTLARSDTLKRHVANVHKGLLNSDGTATFPPGDIQQHLPPSKKKKSTTTPIVTDMLINRPEDTEDSSLEAQEEPDETPEDDFDDIAASDSEVSDNEDLDEDYFPELEPRKKPKRKPQKTFANPEELEINPEDEEAEDKKPKTRKKKKQKKSLPPVSKRTCPTCNQVFGTISSLKNHINTAHLRQVVATCSVCFRQFYSRSAYDTHSKTHLTAEEIKHLTLANKLDAVKFDGPLIPEDASVDLTPAESGKTYSKEVVRTVLSRTCETCKKLFPSIRQKQQHCETVHSEEPCICEVCGKSCKNQVTLKSHMLTHNEGKSYTCKDPNCSVTFKTAAIARSHYRTVHLKQYVKLCPHCGKKLAGNSAFHRHIFTHHTDNAPRNFQCHICPKTFLTNTLLTLHLKCRSHGGPGLPKRKWIPKVVREQMRMQKDLE